ncbi:MAG: hypothetical protein HY328_14765 [Chloroflexi bacterium]|nr:hypothetical protein [Chloroflexota bacterium]
MAPRLLNKSRWILLLALVSAVAVATALTTNLGVYAHDAAAEHIPRGLLFSGAISEGNLYPAWVQFLHVGLGSPLFTFQPPLPYYGLDLLARLGLAHPLGWRVLIGGGLLVAFLGAFSLAHITTGRRWAALAAATAYLYAPYVLRNALERGSNEAFGMFLYPWVLWGLLRLAQSPTAGRFVVAALIWAASIGMHVLAPLMLAPVALLVALVAGWRWRTATPLLALLVGGLLMSAVWLPMLEEQSHVHIERNFSDATAIPIDNPIPLENLLALPALYDTQRDNNNVGDRIGLLQTFLLFLGLPGTLYALRQRRYRLALTLGLATAVGLTLFWLFTGSSNLVWQLLDPLLHRVQYRTRLMGVQALAASVAIGGVVALATARWEKVVALILTALLLLIAIPSLYVNLQHRFGSFEDRITRENVRAIEWQGSGTALTAFGEFLPRWREKPFDEALLAELGHDFDPQERPLAQPLPGVRVLSVQVTSSAWDLRLESSQTETITLYLLYYPRWKAFLDDAPVAIRPQAETGYIQFDLPAGSHHLAVRYNRSPMQWAGAIVSGLVALFLLIFGVRGWRRRVPYPSGVRSLSAGQEAAPPIWLLVVLLLLLGLKWLVIDPSTTLFRCRSTAERVCGAGATVDVAFVGAPSLVGYTLGDNQARPGGTVRVDLFWEGQADSFPVLKSFVHIRNSQPEQMVNPRTGSDIWAQEDRVTPGGLPIREFSPGKLYRDEFRVALPPDMPLGEYFLEVGWFNPESGEQIEPVGESMAPPLRELWRSVLLPSITVE